MFYIHFRSLRLSINVLTKAIPRIMMKKPMGIGSEISLIMGAIPVSALAIRLQNPIAVALLWMGKILSSVKLAKYEVKNAMAIPYFARKISWGILFWKRVSRSKRYAAVKFMSFSILWISSRYRIPMPPTNPIVKET